MTAEINDMLVRNFNKSYDIFGRMQLITVVKKQGVEGINPLLHPMGLLLLFSAFFICYNCMVRW